MQQQLRAHIIQYLFILIGVFVSIYCELLFHIPALALLGFVFVYERTHSSPFFTVMLATLCDVLLLYPIGTTTLFFAGIELIKSIAFFRHSQLVCAATMTSTYLVFLLWQRQGTLTFIDGVLCCVFMYVAWRALRSQTISKTIL